MDTKIKRQIALYHLRVNPNDRKQGKRNLYNPETDCYCAMGLIGEAFGLPVKESFSDPEKRRIVYRKLPGILGTPSSAVWVKNDSGWSFSQIADHLEKVWEE